LVELLGGGRGRGDAIDLTHERMVIYSPA
jgi:hypothetical protein